MDEQGDAATAEEPAALTLEERVAFLEAQNDGLKRVGMLGLVLVLLLGAIIVHQIYSDMRSVTTRGLTLLTEKDELAGAVTVDPQGRVQFLQARNGMLTGTLNLPFEDFRGVTFYDSEGAPRVLIGEGPDRKTVFVVVDPVRGNVWTPYDGLIKGTAPAPGASPRPGGSPVPGGSPMPKGSPTPGISPIHGGSPAPVATPSPLATP